MTLADKLLSNTWFIADNCWPYLGVIGDNGYGEFRLDRVQYRAHVASYLVHRGPIPKGMYVCHTCDTRDCCNPMHLFLGTHEDNIRDMWAKGRGVLQDTKGELNGHALLKVSDVLEIRDLAEEGYSLADLGRIFNVDISNIWKIVHRKTWRHI